MWKGIKVVGILLPLVFLSVGNYIVLYVFVSVFSGFQKQLEWDVIFSMIHFLDGSIHWKPFNKEATGRLCVQELLVVPNSEAETVMRLDHLPPTGGPLRIKRTVDRFRGHFHWLGFKSEVNQFCQICDMQKTSLIKPLLMTYINPWC